MAETLRRQPPVHDIDSALLALEAVAALAVAHADLSSKALDLLDTEDRNELLGQAATVQNVMARLRG